MFRDISGNPLERNYLNEAAGGKVLNAEAVTVFGNAINFPTATLGLAWEKNTDYTFLTTAQSLEIVSDSANDAAAGTGARTVVINTLDGNFNRITSVITMNGVTPVVLPGTHLFHNLSIVVDSGSNFTNVGNLTIQVAGGGTIQGFIAAGIGVTRQGLYTVPAGYQFLVSNFFYCYAVIGVTTGGIRFRPFLRFPNGTRFQGIWQNLNSNGINAYPLPVPFVLAEKMSAGYQLDSATTATGTFALGLTGVLRKV